MGKRICQSFSGEKWYNLIVKNTEFENNTPLFIDTNLYVLKVWSEFVFNKCDNRILSEIVKREYDLYLLHKFVPFLSSIFVVKIQANLFFQQNINLVNLFY